MDNTLLNNILISSSVRMKDKAKYTGILDTSDLAFMRFINKNLIAFSSSLTLTQKNDLEELLSKIQNKNELICNYLGYSTLDSNANTAPVITNSSVSYDADYYDFLKTDFTTNFTDADGDTPKYLKIVTLPAYGTFTYNNVAVQAGDNINLDSFGTLRFTRTNLAQSVDTFTYKVSDNNTNQLFSNMSTFTININQTVNLAPDNVGDLTINLASGVTHTFTQANFTTETTPAYSDPDGDAPENVKITSISGLSTGTLKYNGTAVTVNQVVPYSGIGSGLLTYEADASTLTLYSDTFQFQISDVGSSTFSSGTGTMTMSVAAYVNQPPTTSDNTINDDEGDVYTFQRADFPASDPEGDSLVSVRFPTLPAAGNIKLNAVNVTVNQEIALTDVDNNLLTYTQAVNAGGTQVTFTFQVKDSNGNWSS